MWCYQKPGFEALLLAELQRQQQRSQFCDTLLKTEGVLVPAHSCILSAISPQISSALSAKPAPPAGQSRLVEFRTLGACTLLRVVRLLYSGEMVGEGERERQEAISAAAELGIHGLVEVPRIERESCPEDDGGQRAEVGVQTEPLLPEEEDGRWGSWRREVRDGCTFLCRDTVSGAKRDTLTQTEELQENTSPPSQSAASFETIDIASFQSLGQIQPNLLPPQIPYIPVSLVYPPEENQTHLSSSSPVPSLQESTAAGHRANSVVAPPPPTFLPPLPSLSSQVTLCAADPNVWMVSQEALRDVAPAEEWENFKLEQFQGNIPGYINYFLNPEKEEESHRGRARGRRRRARVGDARRAGAGERRPGRPRARTGRRGRGGLTQTVDVQEVGVSKLQKLFLQRWSTRPSRTGQGGGAAGRKLYLKTREALKSARSSQRGRAQSKMWMFSPSRDVPPYREGGAGNTQRARRQTTQQYNQDDLPFSRPQRGSRTRAKLGASPPFLTPPMRSCNVHTLMASGSSFQPSTSSSSPGMLSPTASFVSPASSIRYSTPVPPPAPPPNEEQHIDRLLEEVMMGLNIIPKNSTPHPQNTQQSQAVNVLRGVGSWSAANSEMPVLQQQGEGELNEMLERFLLSFEQQVNNCTAREEVEVGRQSSAEAAEERSQIRQQQHDATESSRRTLQPHKAQHASPAEQSDVSGTDRRRRKKRKNEYMLSLEKKRIKVKNQVPLNNRKTSVVPDTGDKQLRQMAVVKLEKRDPLPVRVTLQEHSSLNTKNLAVSQISSSSVKGRSRSLSCKNQNAWWSTKTYPIRSRFKDVDCMPFLEQPLVQHKHPRSCSQTSCRRGGLKKEQHLSLADNLSQTPQIQPQPEEPCAAKAQQDTREQEEDEETSVEEVTIQTQGETDESRGGSKRSVGAKETSDDVPEAKRVCIEKTPQLACSETCTASPASAEPAAVEDEDIIDVVTVSVTSVGGSLNREQDQKPVWNDIRFGEMEENDEETESTGDEIIDVEEDCSQSRASAAPVVLPPHSVLSPGSTTGSWENEEIDVLGGGSPTPDPVTLILTDCSKENEEVGIEEEKTEHSSLTVIAMLS